MVQFYSGIASRNVRIIIQGLFLAAVFSLAIFLPFLLLPFLLAFLALNVVIDFSIYTAVGEVPYYLRRPVALRPRSPPSR